MKIYKLKPGKEIDLLAWGARLMGDLRDEALASMLEENCTREYFYIFKIGNDFFVAANMEGENVLPSSDDREINLLHRAMLRKCIEEKIEIQVVYDLKV